MPVLGVLARKSGPRPQTFRGKEEKPRDRVQQLTTHESVAIVVVGVDRLGRNATGVYPEKPGMSVTGQPAATSRCFTRSVSSGEGKSAVSLVIATRTSVASTAFVHWT